MRYNLLKHSSRHSTTLSCNITSQHSTSHSFSHHSIPKDQNTISLNQSISINTKALCNKYTKTQSYMECGTMSMKNLIRRLGVHDKTNHTLVNQVSECRIGQN